MPDMGEKDEDRHMEGGKDLHQVTQPIPCMVGGAMLFCKPEDDAGDGARIEGKFKEWHAHWRVGEDVQKQYKPWEDFDMREEEEALLGVKALRQAAMACKATTGVGVDGVHPGVPLDLPDERCGGILTLLHEVEIAEGWPTNASTTPFFLIPKGATSQRQRALLFHVSDGGSASSRCLLHCGW